MTEWFCTKCCQVVIAKSYKCCGSVERFNAEKHSSHLIGKSNAWIDVWKRWEKHPLLKEITLKYAKEGCHSASAVFNAFVEVLLSKGEH